MKCDALSVFSNRKSRRFTSGRGRETRREELPAPLEVSPPRWGVRPAHREKNKLSQYAAEYIRERVDETTSERTFFFSRFQLSVFLHPFFVFFPFLFLVMEPPPPSLMCVLRLPFFSSLLFSIFSSFFAFFSDDPFSLSAASLFLCSAPSDQLHEIDMG